MSEPVTFLDGRVTLLAGDCMETLKGLPDASIDACVSDPPYHLTSIVKRFGAEDAAPCKEGKTGAYARASRGFMGKQWDGGDIAFRVELWAEVFRVLKPGAHVLAFSATRTYHRMACAIEDAGFEIRDMTAWLYGSGFPKSHDIALQFEKRICKQVEDASGRTVWVYVEDGAPLDRSNFRDPDAIAWEGFGTALKPALEPVCVARKPLIGTVAENVMAHGTGALNIGGCRIGADGGGTHCANRDAAGRCLGHPDRRGTAFGLTYHAAEGGVMGRWPANVIHDGSDEVVAAFPDAPGQLAPLSTRPGTKTSHIYGKLNREGEESAHRRYADKGSTNFAPLPGQRRPDGGGPAARFFYSAKADADDRLGSKHPTVKPLDLMQYLVRLVTPPGGTVLDPFAGTGTTGEAAWREGFNAILCEREEEYQSDIARRMKLCLAGPIQRRAAATKAKANPVEADPTSLFSLGLDAA